MPATDSPAVVVARYLKANHYNESFEAFIHETGLPRDAGAWSKGDLTVETLLEEKRAFDVSVRFEKLGIDEDGSRWTEHAPCVAKEVVIEPPASNVLSAHLEELAFGEGAPAPVLVVSSADRRLRLLEPTSIAPKASLLMVHDSPVLSCAALQGNMLLTTSMSGQLHLFDAQGNVLDSRRDHSKYCVKVAVFDTVGHQPVFATAGWDSKVMIYRPHTAAHMQIGEPQATISLATKPEALLFIRHPDNGEPILLVSRTDSSFIYYYTVEAEPRLLGKQNLAPHSTAWAAFTPCSLEICPTDETLLAVGTNSVPHMKLLIVRLLIPQWDASAIANPIRTVQTSPLDEPIAETPATRARETLAVENRESAAIQIHCTTMAPQSAYSTPAVAWRPDGSGVWVNGDDGAIRGVEASTGKIGSTLQGHEPNTKVRCLCAGLVTTGGESREILVSGGFDQKLILWTAA